MTPQAIFKTFEGMFPSLAAGVTHYATRKGKNTITMDTTAHVSLVFTYTDVKYWRLETLEVANANKTPPIMK